MKRNAFVLSTMLVLAACETTGFQNIQAGAEEAARANLTSECQSFKSLATAMDGKIQAALATDLQEQDLVEYVAFTQSGAALCSDIAGTEAPGLDAAGVADVILNLNELDRRMFP